MSDTTIFSDFLKCLRVKHTACYSDRRFAEAPYADTVKGFRNLLDEYGIRSEIVHVDNSAIKSLNAPFVVQLHGQLAIVTSVGRRSVKTLAGGKTASIPTADFAKQWNGSAIVATPGPDSAEPAYTRHRRLSLMSAFRRYAIPVCAIALFGWFFYINGLWHDVGTCLVAFLDMIGIYTCVLLVGKQLHISSATTDAVCGFLKKGGCQTILDTKASKIFGIIGWGEVGLAYFTVSLIALVFYPPSLPYLALFNAFCLPYTIWSISYQKFKAHSWCTLCVIVQTLQWLLFASYLIAGAWEGLLPLRPAVIVLGVGYLLAFLIIDRVLPVISAAVKSRSLETRYNNLRLRRSVFDIQQSLQPEMSGAENASALVFGDPSAKDTAVLCNDTLSPDSPRANRQAEMLMMKGYRVIYIFADPSLREEDCPSRRSLATEVTRLLTGAYLANGPEKAWQIFSGWYSSRRDSLAYFDNMTTVPADKSDAVGAEIARQQEWAKSVYLYASPAFIFDNRLLSDLYQPADLLFLY